MAISLSKGAPLNLSKTTPGLTVLRVGLGWDPRPTDGAAFDLDASAILLKDDYKVRDEKDLVFYGQKVNADGSVKHGGDNTTGAGDGDDEQIVIDLTKVPDDITYIDIIASIYEADIRGQNFGQVRKAYIRLIDESNGDEIARYDLTEEASTNTAIIFGEVYKNNGEWKFKAIDQGFTNGFVGVLDTFGIQVS